MLSRALPSANPMQHLEVRVVQQNGPKGDGRGRGLGMFIGGREGQLSYLVPDWELGRPKPT